MSVCGLVGGRYSTTLSHYMDYTTRHTGCECVWVGGWEMHACVCVCVCVCVCANRYRYTECGQSILIRAEFSMINIAFRPLSAPRFQTTRSARCPHFRVNILTPITAAHTEERLRSSRSGVRNFAIPATDAPST